MNIPRYAPGCFGSALAFKRDGMVCPACPFAAQCEPEHVKSAVMLRERLGIMPAKPRTQPKVSEPVIPPQPVLQVPARVQALFDRLDKGAYDIVGKLQKGENPFDKTLPHLAVVCHLLLRLKRPVTRDLLTTALATKLDWPEQKAREHSAMAVLALVHVGAVESVDGTLRIRHKETVK